MDKLENRLIKKYFSTGNINRGIELASVKEDLDSIKVFLRLGATNINGCLRESLKHNNMDLFYPIFKGYKNKVEIRHLDLINSLIYNKKIPTKERKKLYTSLLSQFKKEDIYKRFYYNISLSFEELMSGNRVPFYNSTSKIEEDISFDFNSSNTSLYLRALFA